jgi:DNA primase
VLNGKEVTIWPDHDTAGINAAHKIGAILEAHGNKTVRCVNLPETIPHKWDLADKVPDGININKLMHHAPTHAQLSHMIEEKRSPRYLKTFNMTEIEKHAEHNSLSFVLSPEKEFLTLHVANETYRELENWHTLLGRAFNSERMQKQAALTGIYTAWSKAQLDTFKDEKDPLNKALSVGALAARSKMLGQQYINETDRLLDSEKKHQKIEQHIHTQLTMNAPEIMHLNNIAQEELIRTTYRCHTVTGNVLAPEILQGFIKGLEHIPHDETKQRTIVAVINRVIDQYAKNKQPFVHDHLQQAIEQQQHSDTLLLKSVQLGKAKALHLEHQRTAQQDRGFERSL